MSTPAIILLLLLAVEITVHALRYGETREFNFPVRVLDAALLTGLLWWGGFFS